MYKYFAKMFDFKNPSGVILINQMKAKKRKSLVVTEQPLQPHTNLSCPGRVSVSEWPCSSMLNNELEADIL